MTCGLIVRPSPVEGYDLSHAEVVRRGDPALAGLIVHVSRAVEDGFEVFEVWHGKEQYERFTREVVVPVMEAVGVSMTGPPPQVTEFEPRVLMAVAPPSG